MFFLKYFSKKLLVPKKVAGKKSQLPMQTFLLHVPDISGFRISHPTNKGSSFPKVLDPLPSLSLPWWAPILRNCRSDHTHHIPTGRNDELSWQGNLLLLDQINVPPLFFFVFFLPRYIYGINAITIHPYQGGGILLALGHFSIVYSQYDYPQGLVIVRGSVRAGRSKGLFNSLTPLMG